MRGKVPNQKALVTLFKNIFQSSAFLSYNAFYFVWAFCTFSKTNFPLNYYTFGYLSSWIASFLAIFVERENRRSLLATYVSNVVSHFFISFFLKVRYLERRSTTLKGNSLGEFHGKAIWHQKFVNTILPYLFQLLARVVPSNSLKK